MEGLDERQHSAHDWGETLDQRCASLPRLEWDTGIDVDVEESYEQFV